MQICRNLIKNHTFISNILLININLKCKKLILSNFKQKNIIYLPRNMYCIIKTINIAYYKRIK